VSASDSNNANLNRRALLLGAIFLVGGTAALTRFTRDPDGKLQAGPVFSPDQFALLEQVTEVMIPATDTPGALGAGVPAFLRQLLSDWGSNDTRAAIVRVLETIEKDAWAKFGAGFLEIPAERRLELVRSFDEQSIALRDLAYGKFKHLVLLGYYQSEVGATQELRYELVPGAWRSCLPLAEVGRASAV
jgi:gluconate 2-dehydrogenase gamma chain